VLIYVNDRSSADTVFNFIAQKGGSVMATHGGLPQQERQEALDAFRLGRVSVLVATDCAVRGVELPQLTDVINYDFPENFETFACRTAPAIRRGLAPEAVVGTFLPRTCEKTVLHALKHHFMDTLHPLPPILNFECQEFHWMIPGCAYCGKGGHRVVTCPELNGKDKNRRWEASPATFQTF